MRVVGRLELPDGPIFANQDGIDAEGKTFDAPSQSLGTSARRGKCSWPQVRLMSQFIPSALFSALHARALVPSVLDPQAENERSRRRRRFRIAQSFNTVLVLFVALLCLAQWNGVNEVGGLNAQNGASDTVARPRSRFVTSPLRRGDLVVRVAASGTVEPVRLVEVSTELSGTIRAVHVDNNDVVRAGQILAELDSTTLENELLRADAQVAVARARVREARAATVAAAKELTRKERLAARALAPARDLDNATATSARSVASVEALQSEVAAAQSSLAIARANLAKVRVVSPIDGIVLRRSVEPGQTVAASLQSPVLFRLAQDLERMQIRVDVDEADALSVREGQQATFTVQALRDQELKAHVEKLFLGPEVVQGIVTYKAILAFDNSRLGLRPGMTAMAEIAVAHVEDRLLVPNAALRFSPPEVAPEVSLLGAGAGLLGSGIDRAAASSSKPSNGLAVGSGSENPNLRRVWIEQGNRIRPIDVEIGASDGTVTEIVRGELVAGQRVVIDLAETGGAS